MQVPVELTFRNMDRSEALEEKANGLMRKLERHYDGIIACRVVVEMNHRQHHKGNLYHVRIDLTVPGAELVVSRETSKYHAHEDAYVTVRDAFHAMGRRLEEHVNKVRKEIKRHQRPLFDDLSESAQGEEVPELALAEIGAVASPEEEAFAHEQPVGRHRAFG